MCDLNKLSSFVFVVMTLILKYVDDDDETEVLHWLFPYGLSTDIDGKLQKNCT